MADVQDTPQSKYMFFSGCANAAKNRGLGTEAFDLEPWTCDLGLRLGA